MEVYWLQWLHLLAASLWLGGLLFLALVASPVFRHRFSAEERSELLGQMGRKFRPYAWAALGVLVVTGLRRAMLVFGGLPELWEGLSATPYGRILSAKLLLVGTLVVLQFVHDFLLGPRLARLRRERSPGLARARAATIGLALGTVILSLLVLALAARLRFLS
jgi:uncharacterized membrane protein